jgi:pimeloyl-ACP methyl ester carboxylesterase
VLDELGLSGVHLVGGSSGGCYAIHQAVHAPERLASVALLDPTTVGAGFAPKILALGLAAALVDRDWAWRWFLRATAGADLIDRPDTHLVLTGIREFTGKLPPQLPPTREQMRSITLPVLAIYAGDSAAHNAAKAVRRTRDLISHAEVELWPQARHSLHVDQPDRVAQRLLAFTNRRHEPNPPVRPA